MEDKFIGSGKCFDLCHTEPKVMKLKEVKGKGIKSIIIIPELCDFRVAWIYVCPTKAFRIIEN